MARKLNPNMKKRWVKALRSGKFEQGFGRLYLELPGGQQEYCCLGVLACITKTPSTGRGYIEHRHKAVLLDQDVQRALAGINDCGVPFEVIAGLINEAL